MYYALYLIVRTNKYWNYFYLINADNTNSETGVVYGLISHNQYKRVALMMK